MKKTKFLALVLVVAIMMMGAGYAYWTQDLTIENTISTGNLDVVFANPDHSVDSYMDEVNSKVTLTNTHALNVELLKAYPGAEMMISFDLDNVGTLGAHVRGFAIETGEVNSDLVLVKSYKVGDDLVTLTDDTTLAQVLTELNALATNKGIFVEKDKKVKVVLNLEIDPDANNDTLAQNEGNAITFTINSKVHQYNDN